MRGSIRRSHGLYRQGGLGRGSGRAGRAGGSATGREANRRLAPFRSGPISTPWVGCTSTARTWGP
ncbi:MAG: hypothetical protein M0C28_03760 [Candidatus Moduliflexus flocculans]|nr:hypothetical protein [Candidatus Moduliflexus flocculans]